MGIVPSRPRVILAFSWTPQPAPNAQITVFRARIFLLANNALSGIKFRKLMFQDSRYQYANKYVETESSTKRNVTMETLKMEMGVVAHVWWSKDGHV